MNTSKKKKHFTTNRSIYTGHRYFNVSQSFILYILQRFILSLKQNHYAYTSPYMHKTLQTLENEKVRTKANWILRKIVGQVDFLTGDYKSQNNLFHSSSDCMNAQKVRLHNCFLPFFLWSDISNVIWISNVKIRHYAIAILYPPFSFGTVNNQPKSIEKYTPFSHCIWSFEGTFYKNL